MSGIENDKENKKRQRSAKKSKNGSIRKSVSGTKLKKKASQDKEANLQSSEQRSEILDISETYDEKEDKTTSSMRKATSIRRTVSNKSIAQVVVPEPPPTHFLPIVVQLEAALFDKFNTLVTYNRNLVVTKVVRSLMPLFMPGDQITIVDGAAHWTPESLVLYQKGTLARGNTHVAITVIRVWNMTCLTKPQLDQLVPPPEDRLHYFSVKLYCQNEKSGLMLCADKKRVLVQHIRAKTPASAAFLVGDQIIGVGNEMFNPLKEKPVTTKKRLKKLVEEVALKNGYAEVHVCRLVGARSSPAPSLEAELAEKFAGYAVGVQKGTMVEKKNVDPSSLPFHSDALEIALRELTMLKCYEGRDGFEIPKCDKGASQFADPGSTPVIDHQTPTEVSSGTSATSTPSSSAASQQSVMGTPPPPVPLAKTNSTTTQDKAENVTATTPTANTPRKRGSRFKREPSPPHPMSFKEQPELAKITSDVPEEDEMKKCDARSGMVAYIKNMFK